MRMRTYENYRDPVERAQGMASFLGRLNTFFSTFVEGDGDDFAPVSNDDLSELYGIFRDIVELKWGGDADGDLPINFALVDRNRGKLISEILPHDPRDRDLEGKTQEEIDEIMNTFHMQIMRAVGSLAETAGRETRYLENRYSERLLESQRKRENLAKVDSAIAQIEARTDESAFDEDQAAVFALVRKYDAPFHNDEVVRARLGDAMAAKYPERLKAAIEDVMARMAPYSDDNAQGFTAMVRTPRLDYSFTFDKHFTKDPQVSARGNELYRAGKAVRDAARAARAA